MSKHPTQMPLVFRSWGGKRKGAGRPKSKSSGVTHVRRPRLAPRFPVHVTLKVKRDVGKLRTKPAWRAIKSAFQQGCASEGFRVCQFSVQNKHIHLIVEASNQQRLSRGMQGLSIRLARKINAAFDRTGKVFADRFHARILKTPREVRAALNYVLNNRLRHRPVRKGEGYLMQEDGFSTAAWFDGWRKRAHIRCVPSGEPPVAGASTWLLTKGWRRHGLLIPAYIPSRRTH